jgi:excisionase family DNA binding protein
MGIAWPGFINSHPKRHGSASDPLSRPACSRLFRLPVCLPVRPRANSSPAPNNKVTTAEARPAWRALKLRSVLHAMTKRKNREFHSVKRVAKKLNRSEKSVRRDIGAGKLKAHRFGKSIRISDGDLEDYIHAHQI